MNRWVMIMSRWVVIMSRWVVSENGDVSPGPVMLALPQRRSMLY